MPKALPEKKKAPAVRKSPARTPARTPTPAALQKRLEKHDRQLVVALNQRAVLARQITELEAGSPELGPLTPADADVQTRAVDANRGPLPERSLRAVFRELLGGIHSLSSQLKIAYLGPLYSYSHLAAIERFGQTVELLPVQSIAAVFEEVYRKQCDLGLVPIENSTDGRIADTLDMFTRLPVRICGEVELEIRHALLGKCLRAEIREIFSKPQAISQCRNWLAKHMPAARTIEVTSTSTAAQLAKEKPGAAAIASIQAGIHHGLNLLAENISDHPGNTTRFAVIGREPAARTGHDRTAMMFQVEHRPGGLADAINVFKRNRLNLTWIESFPIVGSKRAYLFFVEFDGHFAEPRVVKAIENLKRHTIRLEILGAFPLPSAVAASPRPAAR